MGNSGIDARSEEPSFPIVFVYNINLRLLLRKLEIYSNLILQTPPFILEGDNLTLTCHHRQDLVLHGIYFYKDGSLLKVLEGNTPLLLGKAYFSMTGQYRCKKLFSVASFTYNYYSAELFVSVTEIFKYLVLKLKTTSVIEGDPIPLYCDVALNSALNPLRGNTRLEFAFYKDGHKIQDFGDLDTYQIKLALKKDSGNYTCNVKCSRYNVVRISQELDINVQELVSTPVLTVTPMNIQLREPIVLKCDFSVHPDRTDANLRPTIYKNGKVYERTRISRILSAREYDSGAYMCEVADSSRNIIKYSKTSNILVEEKVVNINMKADQPDPEMLAGSNVTFTCSVSEGTSLSFTWFHNFQKIDKGCATYQVRQDGRVLFIESLQKYHSGSYQCIASNHFSSSRSPQLEVSVIEPIGGAFLSTDKKVLDLVSEDSFTFTCSLSQGNGSRFVWIHNKQHLEEDASTYEFKEGGKALHIKSAQPHHEGSYQCMVEKNISTSRTLVSESGTLTLKISSKGGSYLKPMLIVMAMASILVISIAVYKYQNKLVRPHFLQGKPPIPCVSSEIIEDNVPLMDNIESFERTFNSYH
ncbi:Fc receptor-like protein 2 [Rhinoderma darwinii]|uniref:Fc receptor-like protein 2 n=1 Tax=Rhinoderma darwinii TaxID=43563 RepID=UPI003F67E612